MFWLFVLFAIWGWMLIGLAVLYASWMRLPKANNAVHGIGIILTWPMWLVALATGFLKQPEEDAAVPVVVRSDDPRQHRNRR